MVILKYFQKYLNYISGHLFLFLFMNIISDNLRYKESLLPYYIFGGTLFVFSNLYLIYIQIKKRRNK